MREILRFYCSQRRVNFNGVWQRRVTNGFLFASKTNASIFHILKVKMPKKILQIFHQIRYFSSKSKMRAVNFWSVVWSSFFLLVGLYPCLIRKFDKSLFEWTLLNLLNFPRPIIDYDPTDLSLALLYP
jgi:hypothetical protein